ncbi:acyl--CoA ligase [Arhodomonas aquaeolei]|uniref:class I adenylate-forming enzyme family protein n=1 Tax=Arhodomonas aquaeolei TaxID=2369 RepID=UPI0021684D2B|nr:class I adenylate-forming enzyme family protein [Arhodomonas aquaeolei]MCS4505810.1 acyl--CoA ligase [Arhodomonas aquaeolei]
MTAGTALPLAWFTASAQSAPEAAALECDGRVTAYGELLAGAAGVAAWLRERGIAPGDRVGLLLDEAPAYVAAYYGTLAAGGVVVALNTAAHAGSLTAWLAHAGARFMIAGPHPDLGAVIEGHAPEHLLFTGGDRPPVVAERWHQAVDAGAEWRPAPAAGRTLASLIYTSGTTGTPKGVMISHGNLAANVAAIVDYLRLGPEDRTASPLPFHYSYGNSVLHTHMAAGACLVRLGSMAYPQRVLETLAGSAVTGFSGVAATYALLLGRHRPDGIVLPRLRYLTHAGGPMPAPLLQRLRDTFPRAEVFVMYGQTEATARIAYLPPERLDQRPGSVGRPLPGVQVSVRDPEGRSCPPGTRGEVWVSGPNVMQGYWRAPELTAGVLSDGWLHTGDLGWLDDDGFLYLVGRIGDEIKTGAHRVSPEEVEEVLAGCPGVAEAGVVGMPDEFLGQVIRAVVVPGDGAAVSPRAVLAHCRQRLPAYQVPREVICAAALPRTASGKLQRFRLAADPIPAQQATALAEGET